MDVPMEVVLDIQELIHAAVYTDRFSTDPLHRGELCRLTEKNLLLGENLRLLPPRTGTKIPLTDQVMVVATR